MRKSWRSSTPLNPVPRNNPRASKHNKYDPGRLHSTRHDRRPARDFVSVLTAGFGRRAAAATAPTFARARGRLTSLAAIPFGRGGAHAALLCERERNGSVSLRYAAGLGGLANGKRGSIRRRKQLPRCIPHGAKRIRSRPHHEPGTVLEEPRGATAARIAHQSAPRPCGLGGSAAGPKHYSSAATDA